MARYPKPAEGTWTQHYPELGTEPVSYEDSISPEFFELEREAIFKRAWLQVGRVEQIPRTGSYFTKEIAAAHTSIIVVRDGADVRAFHNICRHRGNKLVWQDYPQEETQGIARQFTCKYHGWRYGLDGACTFAQQEGEFFDLDQADYGLVPVHCDIFAGFIFVNFAPEPSQSLREFLGPHAAGGGGLPLRGDDRPVRVPGGVSGELEGLLGRLHGVLPRTRGARRPASEPPPRHDHREWLRGAALPDRRSARAGHDRRRLAPGVGHAAGEREAGRHGDAQRVVRPVGAVGSR